MSELTVGSISGLASNNFVVGLAEGSQIVQPGSVLQVQHLTYTSVFATSLSNTLRIPVTNFFVDITPKLSSSKILVMANLSVGFSNTPEWSWFVDRTIGNTTTQIGTAAYDGNKMNGYHGGPRDGGATGFTTETESFSHIILDSPGTTSLCRYQVCMQDRWSNSTAKYINRSDNDSNNGYINRGSSSLTLMEIAQ
jgi:hypothetical protein